MKDRDQNYVSRMVGNIWRNMTEDQRAPWVLMAEAEKARHAAMYPDYKYNRGNTPRNKKSKPTKQAVERQLVREAEYAVDAEFVSHIKEEDLQSVYYPPWAARRTLPHSVRRVTSLPPPGPVSIEPYTEMLDRPMVTTNASPTSKTVEENMECPEQRPKSPTEDVFVPSTYGIHDTDYLCSSEAAPSWRITADRLLSQCLYTIDPPGGTSSWGPSPSEYSPSGSTSSAFQVR